MTQPKKRRHEESCEDARRGDDLKRIVAQNGLLEDAKTQPSSGIHAQEKRRAVGQSDGQLAFLIVHVTAAAHLVCQNKYGFTDLR